MFPSSGLVRIPEIGLEAGTGWLPPLPDLRDYTEKDADIPTMKRRLGITAAATRSGLPPKVDLRQWCSPIEDQGSLGSCTANAGVGVIEYFENRAFGRHIDASRLFVYKTTRNLLGWVGDTGAFLRTTMGALALCGAPPAKYWPYTTVKVPGPAGKRTFDDEPPSFVYAIADNYEALRYFCHDPWHLNMPRAKVLESVKKWIAYGVPAMFGFYGFASFNQGDKPGNIPFPCPGENAIWGHAIVAVGYNDGYSITNTKCNKKTKGAFLIRNSWGTAWGKAGYGWIPYDYVLANIANDFWSLLTMGWVDSKRFGL